MIYINSLLKNILQDIDIYNYLSFNQFKQTIINAHLPIQRNIIIFITSQKKVHAYAILRSYDINNKSINIWTLCDINYVQDLPAIWYTYIIYPIDSYFFIEAHIPTHLMYLMPRLHWENCILEMGINICTYKHLQVNKFINIIKYRHNYSLYTPMSSFNNFDQDIDKLYNDFLDSHNKMTTSLITTDSLAYQKKFLEMTNNLSSFHTYQINDKYHDIIINNINDILKFFIANISKQALKQKFVELGKYFSAWILLNRL